MIRIPSILLILLSLVVFVNNDCSNELITEVISFEVNSQQSAHQLRSFKHKQKIKHHDKFERDIYHLDVSFQNNLILL